MQTNSFSLNTVRFQLVPRYHVGTATKKRHHGNIKTGRKNVPGCIMNRNWCFTLNNYTTQELQELANLKETSDKVKYLIYGQEVGDGGTPHLQGYIEFKHNFRQSRIKKCFRCFSRSHLETRKGSAYQAAEYCKKEGNYKEFGVISKARQGRRTDLEQIRDDIKAGASDLEIADNHFRQWVMYRRAFDEYRRLVGTIPRTWKSFTVVLWGPTGTGKTRYVHDQLRMSTGREMWTYTNDGWFDGYTGQYYALFDDFDDKTIPFRLLLRVLDRYPMRLKRKFGHCEWNPRKIFITANHPPHQWYLDDRDVTPGDRDALFRRLDVVSYVKDP